MLRVQMSYFTLDNSKKYPKHGLFYLKLTSKLYKCIMTIAKKKFLPQHRYNAIN